MLPSRGRGADDLPVDRKQRMPRPVDIACLLLTIQSALAAVGAVFMGGLLVGTSDAPWIAWTLVSAALAAGVCGWILADRVSSRRRRVLLAVVALEAAVFAAGLAKTLAESGVEVFTLVNPQLVVPVVVVVLLLGPPSGRAWFDR